MAVGLAVTSAQCPAVDSGQCSAAARKSDLEAVMLELGRTVQYTGVVQCPLLVVVIDRRPLGTRERQTAASQSADGSLPVVCALCTHSA